MTGKSQAGTKVGSSVVIPCLRSQETIYPGAGLNFHMFYMVHFKAVQTKLSRWLLISKKVVNLELTFHKDNLWLSFQDGRKGFIRPVLKHGPRSPASTRVLGWQTLARSENNRLKLFVILQKVSSQGGNKIMHRHPTGFHYFLVLPACDGAWMLGPERW